MRKFKYVEPDENWKPIDIIITEEEILWDYWFHWSTEMSKLGKDKEINIQNCIKDFCVVYEATEIFD